MFAFQSLPIPSKGDVNLVCGTYLLPEVFPELGNIFAPGAQVIHVDLNVYEIAKNHPVDLGILGDPKTTLAAAADAYGRVLSDARRVAWRGYPRSDRREARLPRSQGHRLHGRRWRDVHDPG